MWKKEGLKRIILNKKVFMNMKTKEFDDILNEALEQETRKMIEEQMTDTDHLIDSIKGFQSLSGLIDKISVISDDPVVIRIEDLTPEELVRCCGGDSLGKAQTNLMQGLHHDLTENGFDENDVEIDTEGDENGLTLTIKISPNDDELSTENNIDMEEQTDNGELRNTFGQSMYEEEPKDTNPTKDDKKDIILGDTEMDEQEQTAAGAMAAEENVNEHHKKDKASQIAFICQNDDNCKKEDLEKLSDEEVEKKYVALEKKMGLQESKKKTLRLTENEMRNLIEKIILEAKIESPNMSVPANGVPGLDVTNRVKKEAGKENADALKAVEEKIKKALSFDGNDDPEFPNQIGGEKVSVNASDSQDAEIELNRGRNPADLTYDSDPGEKFKERSKLSLIGSAKMGNSQDYANVIPSKTGENILKASEKRKEARENEPIYDKEAVPVKDTDDKITRPRVDDAVADELYRMKQLKDYNKKTQ